jgi:hypothetical protein
MFNHELPHESIFQRWQIRRETKGDSLGRVQRRLIKKITHLITSRTSREECFIKVTDTEKPSMRVTTVYEIDKEFVAHATHETLWVEESSFPSVCFDKLGCLNNDRSIDNGSVTLATPYLIVGQYIRVNFANIVQNLQSYSFQITR